MLMTCALPDDRSTCCRYLDLNLVYFFVQTQDSKFSHWDSEQRTDLLSRAVLLLLMMILSFVVRADESTDRHRKCINAIVYPVIPYTLMYHLGSSLNQLRIRCWGYLLKMNFWRFSISRDKQRLQWHGFNIFFYLVLWHITLLAVFLWRCDDRQNLQLFVFLKDAEAMAECPL